MNAQTDKIIFLNIYYIPVTLLFLNIHSPFHPLKLKVCFILILMVHLRLGYFSNMSIIILFSSVQFSRSVMSGSLRPHESQHARPPCSSQTPGVHSNPCPSSRWCYLILCRPLLLLPPIPPSIRVFAKESVLPMKWPKYWSFSFSMSFQWIFRVGFL